MNVQEASRPFLTRRTVAFRIGTAFGVVLLLFTATALVALWSLSAAGREAELVRRGYVPLLRTVHELVSSQDTYNAQLNHITSAKNPADLRVWFDTAHSLGRPRKLAQVRAAAGRAFRSGSSDDGRERHDQVISELSSIEALMKPDTKNVAGLFSAMERGNEGEALSLRDLLVKNGVRVQGRLGHFEEELSSDIDALTDAARARERTALFLLLVATLVSALLGGLIALYARRVVAPVSQVTERARAVARGDLSPRPVIATEDEMGEMSRTFEAMVQAISSAREKLLLSERLAAVGKMAAHVTHEIRNPLSSIGLNLELLSDEVPEERKEARTLLRAIGREVARLSELSDQYLSMARRRVPELEACDLPSFVGAVAEFSRAEMEKNGVHLELSLSDSVPLVYIDSAQMRQVLLNLLRNAREAMPDGGKCVLGVVGTQSAVEIFVRDQGKGVPAEVAERLFDPFFTTKDHGTGLGLSVTREVVLAHGGAIRHFAPPEGGSEFRVELPWIGREREEKAQ